MQQQPGRHYGLARA